MTWVVAQRVEVPVCQAVCCRWSEWCHSLGGPAATEPHCKFPSCLWAECRSSLRILSYTRDTADCHPEEKTQPESLLNPTDQYKPGKCWSDIHWSTDETFILPSLPAHQVTIHLIWSTSTSWMSVYNKYRNTNRRKYFDRKRVDCRSYIL